MSAFSDALTALSASVDAATARVTADVAAFNAKIADLQAKVDAGLATQADIDMLASLTAKVDSIDPTSTTVLPPADGSASA